MPKLIVRVHGAAEREVRFNKPSLSVGRKNDNDIVIDSPAISGYHCKIVVQGETYSVEDLDSTNGVRVNDKPVRMCGLHHNDVIKIGKHSIVFIDEPVEEPAGKGGAAAGAEPPPAEAAAGAVPAAGGKTALLKVIKGVVDKAEYALAGPSAYIGKSERAQIPIADSGFLSSAPDVAASIHRKPSGYVLVAVEKGYPVVNGVKVIERVALNDGDIIQCGGTTLQLVLREG